MILSHLWHYDPDTGSTAPLSLRAADVVEMACRHMKSCGLPLFRNRIVGFGAVSTVFLGVSARGDGSDIFETALRADDYATQALNGQFPEGWTDLRRAGTRSEAMENHAAAIRTAMVWAVAVEANEARNSIVSNWQPVREFGDGRSAWIYPLTFGRARIAVGRRGSAYHDDGW